MSLNIAKAELHVHLEGTAPPALIQRIAKRNQVKLASELFNTDNHFNWRDFNEFMSMYELACHAIKQPRDYYDITLTYLTQCAQEGVIYVEITYAPQLAQRYSDAPNQEHLQAIEQAMTEARAKFDIEGRILITAVRDFGVDECICTAKQAVAEKTTRVVGFGLAGNEIKFPPGQFAQAFQIAHEGGLDCTVHAGEHVGPQSIREALTLPIKRLGHGVRAIEDTDLIQEIIDRDICLEICPSSNIALKIYPDYQSHPLLKLIAAGVKVTLNSDDPPYFATTVGKEYQLGKDIFDLSESQLKMITKTAIEAGFVDTEIKQQLIQRVR
ncbi:MAG: adenosine deaminase [Gammaproteobacteria bacterium]